MKKKRHTDDVFTSEKPEWNFERWPWAKWLAQDANGAWHWFEREPHRQALGWRSDGQVALAEYPDDLPHPAWADTLEACPT